MTAVPEPAESGESSEHFPETEESKALRHATGYEVFGPNFIRHILHKERVLAAVDRVLGGRISLGPIGAGPGRIFAKVTANGTYGKVYGEELAGDLVAYRVFVPISLTFDLDLQIDSQRFHADVLLPLTLTVRVEEPLTILWDITPPEPAEVSLTLATEKRRAALTKKVAGLEDELRRFIVRFMVRELEKPHFAKAMRIDMISVIDGAWTHLSDQFLPAEDTDRA